jgi:hypothetical protein
MPVQVIRYKKIVTTGLNPQEVRFAESGAMGHRVSINMPTEYMNKYFSWARAKDELSPTGHFTNAPAGIPTFYDQLVEALYTEYFDQDGVATGLSYASTSLEQSCDSKRDPSIPSPVGTTTHYSANDLVMAYILYKCYGSSSVDISDLIYNIEDAYGMLTNDTLSNDILLSLSGEEMLAQQAVMPNVPVSNQTPGANKGAVDSMFRNLLSLDPLRYFDNSGVQVKGLFEVSVDVDASGSWQLMDGDKIEIPVTFVFRSPVSVLSVQDSIRNPSSATPLQPETVFIHGEEPTFDPNGPTNAAMANTFRIRLQLNCSTLNGSGIQVPYVPVRVSGTTLPTQLLFVGTTMPQLSITNLFAGGTPYNTYSCPNPMPPGIFLSPTGTIYGTPSAATSLTLYPIINTDSVGSSAQVNISMISINRLIQTRAIPRQNLYTSIPMTTLALSEYVSGGIKPYSYVANFPSLPGGLNLNLTTGDLTGTPYTTSPDISFNILATDSSPNMQTIKLSFFMVCENAPPLTISPKVAPGEIHLVVEQPLQNPFELEITGGTPPYSVAITGNSFGASFSPSTGNLLASTSYSGGPAPLKFTVTDSLGASIETSYTLYSHPQLILHPAPQQTINSIVSSTISFPSLRTFGGYLGKTYSISSSSPSSLASLSATMDPATGIFTIIPTTLTPGNYTFLIDVTNSNASLPFTITSTAFIVVVT